MAMVVEVRDERGNVQHRAVDQSGLFRRLLLAEVAGGLLSQIDPYGDTMFNGLQIPIFLRQWRLLANGLRDPHERATHSGIERLALAVESNAHTYLWFIGD